MQNEQNRTDQPRTLAQSSPLRFVLLVAGLALVACLGIVGGYVLLRPSNGFAKDGPDDPLAKSADAQPSKPILFAGWGQPDLAIVVSGQMHGYLFPCGCSEPQNGGLVRRQTFIDELKAKGWPVVGVDLGELPAPTGISRQRELKLEYTMKSLDVMGYRAVGLGEPEMAMPLTSALGQYSLNHANPRPIASSLAGAEKQGGLYHGMNVRPYEIFGAGEKDAYPRVGVLSMTGPDLVKMFKGDKGMKFRDNKDVVMPEIFDAFIKEKVDLAMLLHHEYPDVKENAGLFARDKARKAMAERCATAWEDERTQNKAIPPLQLMIVLTDEPEPPSEMHRVGKTPTHIIEIGHKGKYVGVVGVFNKGGAITLKYELVLMEPAYAPKEGQKNAVLEVMEEYARRVHKEDLLAKIFRSAHPIQREEWVQKKYGVSQFAGSDACRECHKREHRIWANTHHAGAFAKLENATKPSLRQFDPECVVCHTVGFSNPTGYNDLPPAVALELSKNKADAAAVDAARKKHNALLINVGCESCHGPASVHIANQFDEKLYPLINPFRPSAAELKAADDMNAKNQAVAKAAAAKSQDLFTRRMEHIDRFCVKCHDEENDTHWHEQPFLQKWVNGGINHSDKNNVGNRWLPAPRPALQAVGDGKKK